MCLSFFGWLGFYSFKKWPKTLTGHVSARKDHGPIDAFLLSTCTLFLGYKDPNSSPRLTCGPVLKAVCVFSLPHTSVLRRRRCKEAAVSRGLVTTRELRMPPPEQADRGSSLLTKQTSPHRGWLYRPCSAERRGPKKARILGTELVWGQKDAELQWSTTSSIAIQWTSAKPRYTQQHNVKRGQKLGEKEATRSLTKSIPTLLSGGVSGAKETGANTARGSPSHPACGQLS